MIFRYNLDYEVFVEDVIEVDPWPKEVVYCKQRLVLCAKVRDEKNRMHGYMGFVTREALSLIKENSDKNVYVYVGLRTATSRDHSLMARLDLEASDLTIIEDRTVEDDD